uniref:Uncharacterized protein n=1 Tax=Trypanosoma vivax (strain Y486) TaxID=1055687 RepID=G0U7E0_TRYVY|nr:hypothetical protein TVY486_1008440 [Trypanosoma vivax Y486]
MYDCAPSVFLYFCPFSFLVFVLLKGRRQVSLVSCREDNCAQWRKSLCTGRTVCFLPHRFVLWIMFFFFFFFGEWVVYALIGPHKLSLLLSLLLLLLPLLFLSSLSIFPFLFFAFLIGVCCPANRSNKEPREPKIDRCIC